MAKKTTKPVSKSAAKPSGKSSAKQPAKSSAKMALKVTKPAAKSVKPVKATVSEKKVVGKKVASSVEVVRPALMTARGKVKNDDVVPAEPKVEKAKSSVKAADSKDFDNNGEQLIAMAKEEMSKINRTGDSDKSAEKTSKFKPIKIERGNLTDEKAKWQELNKRYGKEKAAHYKMSDSFESLKPIQHKVLGWGFILTNDNNRLEVLFENGIKMLISNYKAN